MAQGWISLNRELMNHWVWDCEFSAGQAWVDLLLYANHSHAKLMIKGQLIEVNRGQQARSELTLSKAWKWSRNKVRRFLKNLEKDGMIELKSGHLTTVITICNYDSFQSNDTAGDTTKGQQSKQLKDNSRNTNNNVNNENNENKPLDQSKIAREELIQSSFDYWWKAYPTKTARKASLKKWQSITKKMDDNIVTELTNHIVADVKFRLDGLANGDDRFIGFDRLHPSTYLNQERYNDDF
ncbi:replication protein [Pseudoalteromonas phage SL25]|nr:replication protein [Pseudoalteromonas phage SL25]